VVARARARHAWRGVLVAFQAFFGSYLEVRTLALFLWFIAALVAVLAKREELV